MHSAHLDKHLCSSTKQATLHSNRDTVKCGRGGDDTLADAAAPASGDGHESL